MMNNKKDIVRLGKQLAFLLRHDQEAFSKGVIDGNGWRHVRELCDEQGYSKDILEEIVATNAKQRYEYNNDKTKIRARQGHSIPVDVGLKEEVPPSILWHGTSSRLYDVISSEGIKKMSRQYVHLSGDIETAQDVGKRHVHKGDKVIVFSVNTQAMHDDGVKFWKSNNGVWLTGYVDPKYLKSSQEY